MTYYKGGYQSNYNQLKNSYYGNPNPSNIYQSQFSSNQNYNTNYNQNTNLNYNSMDYDSNTGYMAIKWRDVMKIDLDALNSSQDLSPVGNYLNNIIYSNISENEIGSVPEGNIVKLIKIYQNVIRHYMRNNNQLEYDIQQLQDENSRLINENESKEATLQGNKDLITKLKKQKQNDDRVLLTYKNVIQNMGKIKRTDINVSVNNSNYIRNRNENIGNYDCQYCPGIRFTTENEYIHHMRIHDANYQKQSMRDGKLENKIDELKDEFSKYIQNLQDRNKDNFNNQNKIDYDRFQNQIDRLGDKFEKTISELSALYKENINKNIQNPIIIPQNNPEKIIYQKDNSNNELIQKLIEENNKKMNLILEERDEEREKERKKYMELLKEYEEKLNQLENQNPNQSQNIRYEKNITINQAIEEKEPEKIYRKRKENVDIIPSKTTFKAGDLESDNEEENIRGNDKKIIIKNMKETSNLMVDLTEISKKRNENIQERRKETNENPQKEKPIEIKKGRTNLDMIEEEKISDVPKKEKLRGKGNKRIITEITTLNEFYQKYRNREKEIFRNANEENYLEEIIGDNYQENENNLNKLLNTYLDDTISNVLRNNNINNRNIDEELKNKNIDELQDLIKNSQIISDDKITKSYFESISKYVDLDNLKNDIKTYTNIKESSKKVVYEEDLNPTLKDIPLNESIVKKQDDDNQDL